MTEESDSLDIFEQLLPEELRAPLQACEIEGLDDAEIAATLGIERGRVRSRLHRARRALVTELNRQAGDGAAT